MKIQRILFPLLILLFLCGPVSLYCALETGVNIPLNLTAEPAKYLEGSQHDVDLGKYLNIKDILKGEFQDAMETKLDNFIPARATAIIANADLQRTAITISNSLFSWNCYPTYFGSERIYLPESDAVGYIPVSGRPWWAAEWQPFAKGLQDVASRHPDKRFVVYVVGGYGQPAYSPAYGLVSDPLTPGSCIDFLKSMLEEAPNISILAFPYENAEDYYNDFFRTDHHWNINGAFKAYQQIASALNLETIPENGTWDIPDFQFSGATARWALDPITETTFDSREDFAALTATRPDGTSLSCADHSAFWNATVLNKHYSFYDLYYDKLGDCVITGGIGTRSALLVGNSYRGALQRPLAYSYKQLSVNWQLHPSTKVTTTLDEQIAEAAADDIIFVANPSNLRVDDSYWELAGRS